MTAKQTGRNIHALSRRRTSIRRGKYAVHSKRKREKKHTDGQGQLAQLVICAILFITVVTAKIFLPAKLDCFGEKIAGAMQKNMDVVEVFSAVGRAFSGESDLDHTLDDVYQAVFKPESDAVETVATAEAPFLTLPTAETTFCQFRQQKCQADCWLQITTPSTVFGSKPANTTTSQSEEVTPESALPEETTVPESTVQTERLTCVLYAGETLPEEVSIEPKEYHFAYCTPVKGSLTSGFGYRIHPIAGVRRFHYGVDIGADIGTEIDSFATGTVNAVGKSNCYGNYLIIDHSDGCRTLYAHCSKILVSAGKSVKMGEKIAEVGETGIATGPHLHFEVHDGDTYLNPLYYVEPA